MSHDYKHRAKSNAAAKQTSGWVWLMVGLLAGAFLMGLAWLKLGTPEMEKRWISSTPDNPPQSTHTSPRTTTRATPPGKPSTEQKPPTQQAAPKFEFFEKLPKQEVVVTSKPLELRGKKAQQNKNTSYYLQIASFNTRTDAERLQAELGFLGIEAAIQQVKVNTTLHYRVSTGPYVGWAKLQSAQKQLNAQGYKRLLVVEKK